MNAMVKPTKRTARIHHVFASVTNRPQSIASIRKACGVEISGVYECIAHLVSAGQVVRIIDGKRCTYALPSVKHSNITLPPLPWDV